MVTAVFDQSGNCRVIYGDSPEVKNLWQWDYGQVLRIQGLKLPSIVQIHFSLRKAGGESVTRLGITKDGVTEVPIPEFVLENQGTTIPYDFYAFVYLTDETSGRTAYKITINVKSRPKPEVPGGGEDPDIFHDAVQAVQKSADKAAESERQAEGWAHGREDLPERAQDNAKYYSDQAAADAKKTGADRKEVERLVESVSGIDEQVAKVENLTKQAQTSATNAALSEQAAKTAETNAQTAQAGAETAEGNAELAEQGAKASEQAVEKAKQLVIQMGQEVLNNKNHVDQTAHEFTLTAQQAVADVNNAGQTQTERVQAAGNTAVESVKTAQDTATKAVEAAKAEAVQAVRTEGTTQTGTVTAEGTKQVQAVQQAAQEIVADREQIEKNKVGIECLKQGKADAIVETVLGETVQAEDSSDLKFERLRIFGKSIQDGTPSLESPVPITNVGDKGNITVTINGSTEPQSLTLQTPTGLPGLKVNKGGSYTDSNGQRWVCDEIDLERGKYVQRVKEIVINHNSRLNENLANYGAPEKTTIIRRITDVDIKKSGALLCRELPRIANWKDENESVFPTETSVDFRITRERLGLGTETTTEENSAAVLKYLETHPLYCIAERSNTIEHDLAPEEIAAYKALHTNYPTTEISNDESAHMEASYVADTKNYIAKKIEVPFRKQITDLQSALISQKISGGGYKSN